MKYTTTAMLNRAFTCLFLVVHLSADEFRSQFLQSCQTVMQLKSQTPTLLEAGQFSYKLWGHNIWYTQIPVKLVLADMNSSNVLLNVAAIPSDWGREALAPPFEYPTDDITYEKFLLNDLMNYWLLIAEVSTQKAWEITICSKHKCFWIIVQTIEK